METPLVNPLLQELIYLVIAIAVTFLVTEGAKALFAHFGVDISGGVSQIIATTVGLLVMLVTPLLAQIPEAYAPYIIKVIEVLLAIFSAFGVHRTAVRFGGNLTAQQKNVK